MKDSRYHTFAKFKVVNSSFLDQRSWLAAAHNRYAKYWILVDVNGAAWCLGPILVRLILENFSTAER